MTFPFQSRQGCTERHRTFHYLSSLSLVGQWKHGNGNVLLKRKVYPGILLLLWWYRKKIGPRKKYWYRSRKKMVLEKSTGTGPGKNCVPKKEPEPVPEKIAPGTREFPGKIGPEKKYWYRSQKNWSWKKVPVPVPEKNGPEKKVLAPVPEQIGPGEKYRYRKKSRYRHTLLLKGSFFNPLLSCYRNESTSVESYTKLMFNADLRLLCGVVGIEVVG